MNIVAAVLIALLGAHAPDAQLVRYIVSVDPGASVICAARLSLASERARAEFGVSVPPERLATLARYESGFHEKPDGQAGERGILQIHPDHAAGMAALGLSFDNRSDRLVYGCLLYAWHGDRPWTVRRKARRDYRKWFADEEAVQ